MKPKQAVVIASLALALFIGGCATVSPTANQLVVRCEQSQTVTFSTFDAVVHLDDSNRAFWKTNAPEFHAFAEWLRQPVVLNATNTLPRGAAIIWSVDQTKLTYKQTLTGKDQLVASLAAMETALREAQTYLYQTSISNKP